MYPRGDGSPKSYCGLRNKPLVSVSGVDRWVDEWKDRWTKRRRPDRWLQCHPPLGTRPARLSEEAGRAVGRSEWLLETVQRHPCILLKVEEGKETPTPIRQRNGSLLGFSLSNSPRRSPTRPPRPKGSLRAVYGAKLSARGETGPTSGAGEALHKGRPRPPPTLRLSLLRLKQDQIRHLYFDSLLPDENQMPGAWQPRVGAPARRKIT